MSISTGCWRSVRGGSDQMLPASPSVQAVFCIDVRSEPFRRHLEAESDELETLGFAGFFGVALECDVQRYQSARCPVLLKPTVSVSVANEPTFGVLPGVLREVQSAAPVAYSFVETLGLAYGIGLAHDLLAAGRPATPPDAIDPFALREQGNRVGDRPGNSRERGSGDLEKHGAARTNRSAGAALRSRSGQRQQFARRQPRLRSVWRTRGSH